MAQGFEKRFETDEAVEEEIARLQSCEAVKLARKEYAIRERRRAYMYSLRNWEKKGLALMAQGYTIENIAEMIGGEEETEDV